MLDHTYAHTRTHAHAHTGEGPQLPDPGEALPGPRPPVQFFFIHLKNPFYGNVPGEFFSPKTVVVPFFFLLGGGGAGGDLIPHL